MFKVCVIIVLIFLVLPVYQIAADGDSVKMPVEISLPRMVNGVMEKEQAIVEEKTNEYNNKYVAVNIHRPVIKMKDKQIEKAINDKIGMTIDSFEKEVLQLSKKDNEYNINHGIPVKPYVINVNNTVHYNQNDILSITVDLYSYMGGAHGSTVRVPFNFDLKTGNRGSLEDFFGNNENYKDIILKEIKNKIGGNPDIYYKEALDKYKSIPYNQKFYLEKENLVIYFDEYEIAPYAAGIIEFPVPYSLFPNGINKVNIQKEMAVVSVLKEEKMGAVNKYICYPWLENPEDEDMAFKVNEYFKDEIDGFVEKAEGENVKGITTYFISAFNDKSSLTLYMTFLGINEKDEEVMRENRKYYINLERGEINLL